MVTSTSDLHHGASTCAHQRVATREIRAYRQLRMRNTLLVDIRTILTQLCTVTAIYQLFVSLFVISMHEAA